MVSLHTKRLHGTTNIIDWQASWKVFKTAMLIFDAASTSALDSYEKVAVSLTRVLPSAWGIISVVDALCRTEQWDALFDVYSEVRPHHFDRKLPWDTIIYDSAFGVPQGPLTQWRKERVDHPAGLSIKEARSFLALT